MRAGDSTPSAAVSAAHKTTKAGTGLVPTLTKSLLEALQAQLATQYRKPQVEGIVVHLLTIVPDLLAVVMHG
jgi:hypothetical protein